MSSVAEGVFKIEQWDENTVTEYEGGSKLTRACVRQTYRGDCSGTSELEYLMVHFADQSATFTGYEKLECTIGGKQGSMVLHHDGRFAIGVASSCFRVVSGSGRGELMNITGSGTFESGQNGEASYRFEFNSDSGDDQAGA